MTAQQSSEPRSPTGRAQSRFNALKHGIYAVHQIIFDEKPKDLAELAAEYREQYTPADGGQRFLVDTLVHNEWRLRRLRRVGAELWRHAYNPFAIKNIPPKCTSGDAFATGSFTFERLQRIANSCDRVYHMACEVNDPSQKLAPRPNPLRRPQPSPAMPRNPNNRNLLPGKWVRSAIPLSYPSSPAPNPSPNAGITPDRSPRFRESAETLANGAGIGPQIGGGGLK